MTNENRIADAELKTIRSLLKGELNPKIKFVLFERTHKMTE